MYVMYMYCVIIRFANEINKYYNYTYIGTELHLPFHEDNPEFYLVGDRLIPFVASSKERCP